MSIEVGGTFGISFVWRDKTERWHTDCMGAKKNQDSSVMCWGIIGYGWKGPFHVWDPGTEEEKQEAESEILLINTEMEEEAEKANAIWRNSAEWATLQLEELATAQIQRQAERNGAPKKKVDQIWRRKKFKVDKLKWGVHIHGVDAWRYAKHVAIPLMWPECHRQLQQNPHFFLIEDGASPHTASYGEWPPSVVVWSCNHYAVLYGFDSRHSPHPSRLLVPNKLMLHCINAADRKHTP